ncbi:MAG: hypothetical protein GTN59_00920 [Candidatus Dadabacteria bacterium]|nr:hypothetical protein [Candidatus Dadabacteria bacterium]
MEKKQIDESEFENNKEDIKNSITLRKKNEIYDYWLSSIRKQAEIIPNSRLFPDLG